MGPKKRKPILERFGSQTRVLTSVLLFTEGWNRPDIGALILARPTKSLRLHLQMIGRGLQTAPGKTDCILLDHAGNFHEHGPPDVDRAWKLESRPPVGCGEFPEFERSGERSFATEERSGLLREFRGNYPADAYGSSDDPAVQCLIDHARRKGYKPGYIYYKRRDLLYALSTNGISAARPTPLGRRKPSNTN